MNRKQPNFEFGNWPLCLISLSKQRGVFWVTYLSPTTLTTWFLKQVQFSRRRKWETTFKQDWSKTNINICIYNIYHTFHAQTIIKKNNIVIDEFLDL